MSTQGSANAAHTAPMAMALHLNHSLRSSMGLWLAASVYTEMNAISKGVAIGLYDEAKRNGVEANKGGAQPYVDLMGRRYVLLPLLHVPIRPVNLDLRLSIPHPLTNTECTYRFLLSACAYELRRPQRAETLSAAHSTRPPQRAGMRFPLARPSRRERPSRTLHARCARPHRSSSARCASSRSVFHQQTSTAAASTCMPTSAPTQTNGAAAARCDAPRYSTCGAKNLRLETGWLSRRKTS